MHTDDLRMSQGMQPMNYRSSVGWEGTVGASSGAVVRLLVGCRWTVGGTVGSLFGRHLAKVRPTAALTRFQPFWAPPCQPHHPRFGLDPAVPLTSAPPGQPVGPVQPASGEQLTALELIKDLIVVDLIRRRWPHRNETVAAALCWRGWRFSHMSQTHSARRCSHRSRL